MLTPFFKKGNVVVGGAKPDISPVGQPKAELVGATAASIPTRPASGLPGTGGRGQPSVGRSAIRFDLGGLDRSPRDGSVNRHFAGHSSPAGWRGADPARPPGLDDDG